MIDGVWKELIVDDEWLDSSWRQLQEWMHDSFGIEPGIEGILFLIGVQASGRGYQPHLRKERKQDLIMDGTYRAFEALGLYREVRSENGEASVWERSSAPMPQLSIEQQEKLLKLGILRYFSEQKVGIEH